jgi:hypothetical protein
MAIYAETCSVIYYKVKKKKKRRRRRKNNCEHQRKLHIDGKS